MNKNELTRLINAEIGALQAALAELSTYRPSENNIRIDLHEAHDISREIWNGFLNFGTLEQEEETA